MLFGGSRREADACRILRDIGSDRRGSVFMMLGMMLVVLCGFGGIALDYANVLRVELSLQAIADAATLASVTESSTAYTSAMSTSSDGTVSGGSDAVITWFNSAIQSRHGISVGSVNANVVRTNGKLNATMRFTATTKTFLLGVVGLNTITITGSSTATNVLPIYMDFYLLLDNSPSMGVAATPNDIATMVANTPDQCAFACHDQSNPNNYYNLAKTLGVTTRIDVLRTATQQLMSTAPSMGMFPDQYRAAIYTFNRSVSTITDLASDLTYAASQAAAIDLVPVPFQGANNDEYTDYNAAMTAMNATIPNPGDGASNAPQKVLFMVSDGVNDSDVGGTRTISPIDTSLCSAIKSRGIKIAVLYTTYLPLPTNNYYMSHVDPWVGTIAPTMQSCASPGLYFEVSPTQGITEAMQALFLRVTQNARLTQ